MFKKYTVLFALVGVLFLTSVTTAHASIGSFLTNLFFDIPQTATVYPTVQAPSTVTPIAVQTPPVTLPEGVECSIMSFTASPTTVAYDGSSTISWSVSSGCTSITFNGTAITSGLTYSKSTGALIKTTSYILSATGQSGAVEKTVTVTVVPVYTINSFTANPSIVSPGGSSTFSWTTSGCTQVNIGSDATQTCVIGGVNNLALNGSFPTNNLGCSLTLTLSAINSGNLSMALAHATARVSDTTPRIAYWSGKVNQHVDATGTWQSDPDEVSGATINQLTYCQKWYPNTISVSPYEEETITDWKQAAGYPQTSYTAIEMSYQCDPISVVSNGTPTNIYTNPPTGQQHGIFTMTIPISITAYTTPIFIPFDTMMSPTGIATSSANSIQYGINSEVNPNLNASAIFKYTGSGTLPIDPNGNYQIPAGQTKTFDLIVTYIPTVANSYRTSLLNISWNTTDSETSYNSFTAGLNSGQFQTPYVAGM